MLLLEDKIQGWEKQKKGDNAGNLLLSCHTPGLLSLPNLEAREGIPNTILSLQGEDTMSVLPGK